MVDGPLAALAPVALVALAATVTDVHVLHHLLHVENSCDGIRDLERPLRLPLAGRLLPAGDRGATVLPGVGDLGMLAV